MDDLERDWNNSLTPTWLMDFLETIANSYKSTRGELKTMESHQKSEYHQEMFYHHYDIATKMRDCYRLGKLDLDQTERLMNYCLNDYENISVDDRDNTLDDSFDIVNELLQEVRAEIDKLSKSVPDLKHKEFVETCLALGNIDNNSEMLSHLAECSQGEKKHLEQLIRSTQLVRLVVSLEESALFQTFQRIAIPTEDETGLARAYHLAKYGKLMEINSMNIKPNQQVDDEPVLYGSAKQRIQKMIECEIVMNKLSLEQMKLFITRNVGKELSITDAAFVEDEYKEIYMDQGLEAVTKSMKAFLRSHGETDIINILNLLERMTTCEDFPDYFKSLDYLKELFKLSLNENEELRIVKHFKTICLEHIDDYCNAVKSELELLSCLKSYLSHSRHVKTALNRLGITENTSKVDFEKIKNIIDQENNEHLIELKCIVSKLQPANQLIIEDKLLEAIRSFTDPVQIHSIKVDGREVVEVIGKHVVLSEVLESVEEKLANDFGSEVRIIGKEVFHIDADLVNDIWHGKNVAVRSKLIIVHGTVVWDVSGKNNKYKFSPARSASTAGGNGSPGSDGKPGECGGNVLILTEQMEYCEAFTIVSNGGNGSDGQDGGNGCKGQDGVGITEDELKGRFKSPVLTVAIPTNRGAEFQRIKRRIETDFSNTIVRKKRGLYYYTEACNYEGQKITFSFCGPKIFQNYSYCYLLCKGSLGKAGGQGGDFGLGGQGGFPGQIAVKSIVTGEMFKVTKQSALGQDGRPGEPGQYGNTGSNGWDMGYLDYQFWEFPIYSGKDCKSKLTITYHNESSKNNVWCWYKNKYATLTTAANENNVQSRHQVRQCRIRDRMQSACTVMKKTINESSFIADYDQHFTTVKGTLLLIQNIQQRAMQGFAEQRKKTNEKQKIHHIISFQNKEQDVPLVAMPNTAKRRGLKSTTLLNLDFNVDSVVNWRQLKYHRIEKSDLIAIFGLLTSANIPEKDLLNFKQNLMNKYKLIIFEQLSEKINTENYYSDKAQLASKYTSICLEEDSQQSGLMWHDILGTLDEYLYHFTDEKQQKVLSKFCSQQGKHLLSSVALSFLADELNENCSAQSHLDHYKIFAELQDYDSTNYLEHFMKELIQSTYSKVLHLWCHVEERSSLVPKLMHEINQDYRLGTLHSRYVKCRNKTFNWEQCLQDEQILEAFLILIIKKGPLTRCYRELLAFAFGVNLQIFVRDYCGRLSLQDSHNAEANKIVYFLLQNETFIKLSLNENWMKLEDDRRCRAKKYSQISELLMLLEDKRSIDDFMVNFDCNDWNVAVLNEKEDVYNSDLTEQLLKYFSSGERHSMEKLLNQSDVSSSVYSKLLRNILFRFDAESIHVSADEIYYLVNQYLVASNIGRHQETLISWIILAYPQSNWIGEVLLLQLEKYFRQSLVNKCDWRLCLTKVENKSLLILLSAKLDLNNPGNKLTTDKMDGILRLLYLSTAKPETLQQLDLSDWYYLLEELDWTEKLQQIAHWETDCRKFKEASYYTVSLLNNYGCEILEQLFSKLAQKCAKDNDIVDVLWNVYNGRCLLTDQRIARLDMIGVQDWIKESKSHFMDNQERDIDILIKLIEDNKNASRNILQNLDNLKKDVQKINRDQGIVDNNQCNKNAPRYLQQNLDNLWFVKKIKFPKKTTVEKLKDIDDAINEIFNFRLRNSQKLTILALLKNDKNTLAQVATGEGKSLIVVAVAIIKAATGQKVDIITSSSVLAKRDAEQSKSIYAKFGIDVSHNCSEDIEKRKEAYSKNQVIYGDLSSFQRDYLLHNFYQKNVLGDRNFVNVIVDEVDSMLLDRGNNMLYLAHDLPDMDKLESVYVFIWQWVNNSSKKLDMTVIRDAVLWQIYGIIKPDDMGKLNPALNEEQRSFIWNKLVKVKIIDDEGKLMTDTINKYTLEDVLGSEFSIYLDRLEYLLKECINREKCIYVPNYLRSFVELHLKSWIEAAKMALVMEAGQDYVVDVDRSGSSGDRTPNITILDRDTGTDLVNSQWEAALHQFVQLKHGCKIYLQSLKSVFISNVKYFKMYQHLYGLSGTLGSHRERDLLGEIYGVDFINIPMAKLKQFHEDAPIVCQNVTDWTNTIIKSVRNKTDRKPESTNTTTGFGQRSVLIICETLNDVKDLYKAFGGIHATNVRTYTREYEEFNIEELSKGQIIIATNLAGRGTDIKISQELRKAGGLHVCLTYLPPNIRVEQQAFGRAARCGDMGSGQLIVLDPGQSQKILQLKRERDSRELSRISQIKKYYETRVVLEENCFNKFTKQYDMLRKLLTSSDVTKSDEDLREILLSSILDRWVFWLDENEKNLVTDVKNNSHRKLDRSLDVFLNHLKSLNANNYESLLEWVDASMPRMVKLGRFFLQKQRKLACTLFERIIAREAHFSEAAHYYYAYALPRINRNFVDSVENKKFTLALRSAANLYQERIQNITSHVFLIDKMKTNLKDNSLPITAYKEQKQITCKLYDTLSKSVDCILGHPVSATSFVYESIISKTMSVGIFKALLAKKILQYPTLKDPIGEEELHGIGYRYGTSTAKLKRFLENYSKNLGRSVQYEQFVRLLKEQIQLPSREGFWRYLLEKRVLKSEMKYVLVDRNKLSHDEMQSLDARVSQIRLETRPTVNNGELSTT